jgi:large subunit ribosomal protein L19
MNSVTAGIIVSPVHMEDRKNLGIKSGDTVRVHQKIEDKGKTRIQVFEGLVLARKHGNEAGATFTVRKMVDGIGVEKIFPLYSPRIDKIEIVRRSTTRRAKLYFIREKVAREIKRQMRRMRLMNISSESEIEMKIEHERKIAEEAATKAKEAEEKAKADVVHTADTTVSEAVDVIVEEKK